MVILTGKQMKILRCPRNGKFQKQVRIRTFFLNLEWSTLGAWREDAKFLNNRTD